MSYGGRKRLYACSAGAFGQGKVTVHVARLGERAPIGLAGQCVLPAAKTFRPGSGPVNGPGSGPDTGSGDGTGNRLDTGPSNHPSNAPKTS